MGIRLLACPGGELRLPDRGIALVSREDGGHLIVDPPRAVWERSDLVRDELFAWSALVAAAGRAMIDALPQLAGGCVNYWEAGNWSLHDAAPPAGRKLAPDHRRVHLHLLGRSPSAQAGPNAWGEAPAFPRFADRITWAAAHERLTPRECDAIVRRTLVLLADRCAFPTAALPPSPPCPACGYPVAL
jgi:hypothetical protein